MASYMVLGAGGRQGRAVAYYLAKYCESALICLADPNNKACFETLDWLKKILGPENKTRFTTYRPDGFNENFVRNVFYYNVVIAALPHELVYEAAQKTIEAGAHYCDYGFDTGIITRQLALADDAKKQRVAAIFNNGVGPGLNNIIAVGGAREFDCDAIEMILGGIPQDPNCNPIGYESAFINLLDEYFGELIILENGEPKTIVLPDGLQNVQIAGINHPLEAFFTDVGSSMAAEILQKEGKIENFWEKTARWEGHFDFLKKIDFCGLTKKRKILVGGSAVSPHEVTKYCFDNLPRVKKDLMIFQILFKKDGCEVARVEMLIYYDPATGLTAMQQTTSSSVAVVARLLAENKIPPGCYIPEDIVNRTCGYRYVIGELQKMGLPINIHIHEENLR